MRAKSYAGYRLTARRPASSAAVEHWWAEGPDGPAEVYLGPEMLVRRARALPVWGPFADILTGREGLRSYVVVRGRLDRTVDDLRGMLAPGACVALAWHLAAALAEVHERGGAHGALHPGWTGVDAEGRLTIRPALTAAVRSDPDGDASAQATDCIQLAAILEALELERLDEPGLSLLMRGIARDRARLRLQPGRAVRQSLSYVLHRHPDWENSLVDTLGEDWRTTLLPRAVAPLPEARDTFPWADHGTHIPRVGSGPMSGSSAATVDMRDAPPIPRVTTATASAPSVQVSAPPEPRARPVSPAAVEAPEPTGVRVKVRRATVEAPPPTPLPEPPAPVVEPPPAEAPAPPAPEPPAPEPPAPEPPAPEAPEPAEDPLVVVEPEPVPVEPPTDVPEPAAVPPVDAPTDDLPSDTPSVADPADVAAPVIERPTDITPASPALAALLADVVAESEARAPEPEPEPDDVTQPALPLAVVSEPPSTDPESEEEYYEDDEQTAVQTVPEPVRQAIARLAAERAVRDSTEPEPPVAESAPEPVPEPSPAPSDADRLPPSDDAPRWAGVKGVTGDASREEELGSGKWEEDARPLDELRKEMGATPVRPMEDIDPSRGNWPMLVVALVALAALVALWFATQAGT